MHLRNQITLKLCVSALKRQGQHTVVQATPSNDLSSEMFVFKVLEDMMSRGMYGLAELVVAYAGGRRDRSGMLRKSESGHMK